MQPYDNPTGEPETTVPAVYQPDADTEKLIAEIKANRDQFRQDRRPHEAIWYVTAAMYRGQHYVEFNDQLGRLQTAKVAPGTVRVKVPKIQAKARARLSKFLKNRPKAIVVPATSEYQDYLNAKASQKLLDYFWRELRLEERYRQALYWSKDCGKGFWWISWDESAIARVRQQDPATGATTYAELPLGNPRVEASSTFEILVKDPSIPNIGDQPEIHRLKMRDVSDMKARYPDFAPYITGGGDNRDLFQFERQIASLNQQTPSRTGFNAPESKNQVLVTEQFLRPCGKYPKGAYRVLVGDILVKNVQEIPYGFFDLANPYPVVEFPDLYVAGQFWCPTLMEQATDIQRQYNLISSKLAEHIRTHTHPKLVVYKQHQLPPGAYTNQPGEVLEIVGQPTLGPPFVLQPPNILNDIWRALELLDKQFDEVFQIYPVAEGQADTTNSGFQTNLLQEAVEGVHAPDIRLHELAIEDACVKLRRLAKLGYDVPRLIRTVGSNYQAEILEFSGSQIDEQADVMIEAGSALPFLKAAKQETVMKLFEKGLFGDPTQPEVKRRALSLLEMGSLEEAFDKSKIDEQKARLENQLSRDARPIPPPDLIDNHMIHLDEHAAEIKSPGFLAQAPERQVELRRHFVLHQNILDVNQALLLAQAWGFPDLAEQFQAQLMAQQQAMLQQAMMGLAPAPAPSAQAAPVAG